MRPSNSSLRLLNLVLAGLIGFGAGTSFPGEPRADLVTIRLGYSGAGEEPLWLLIAKPQLVATNYGKAYTFDAIRFESSDKRTQALEAGAIDVANSGATGVVFAAAEGVETKIIASTSRQSTQGFSTPYYAKADSSIKTVADMKGRIVGINGFSTVGQLHLDLALQQVGLSDSDVTITPVPFPAMQEALNAGKIDVGQFPQPFAALVESEMKVRKIFDSRYGMPFDEEVDVLTAKNEFLTKHPAAIRAMLEDLQASTRFYIDHTKEARQVLIDTKMVRAKPEVYLTLQDNYRDPTLRVDTAALEKMQDLMIKAGFQQKRADIPSMVDLSYLPQ